MRTVWSRALAAVFGLLVGGAFLLFAFRGTEPAAVWAVLAAGRWDWPAAVVLAGTVAFVLAKSARWRLLLGAASAPSVAALARPVTAGLALNALLPHAGEFVRAFSLQRQHGLAASAVLSSIVAERVFDLFAVLILAAFALAVLPVPAEVWGAVRLLALVAAGLAAVVLAAVAWPARVRAIAGSVLGPLPAALRTLVLAQVDAALAGLAPVRSPATSVTVLAWSVLQWLAVAACVAGSAAVVGLQIGLPAAAFVVVGIVVAFLLPNAPGYAGSVQVAFLVTLRPQGVPQDAALAASFVYQLLMVLPLVVVGLAWLRASLRRASAP